jgi:hypothetical protein
VSDNFRPLPISEGEMERIAELLIQLRRKRPFLRIDMDWGSALAMVGAIQLALRCPGLDEVAPDSAKSTRKILDGLLTVIDRESPELADLMRRCG